MAKGIQKWKNKQTNKQTNKQKNNNKKQVTLLILQLADVD